MEAGDDLHGRDIYFEFTFGDQLLDSAEGLGYSGAALEVQKFYL